MSFATKYETFDGNVAIIGNFIPLYKHEIPSFDTDLYKSWKVLIFSLLVIIRTRIVSKGWTIRVPKTEEIEDATIDI